MLIYKDARTERRELLCQVLDRLAAAAPTEGEALEREVDLICLGADRYVIALVDLLAALGAVEVLEDPLLVRVCSPLGGYFLRLLSDLFDTGAPLIPTWEESGLTSPSKLLHPSAAAIELLALLERRRLKILPKAAPVREINAVVGIILRREVGGDRAYLLLWDAKSGTWQPPGSRSEVCGISPLATLLRELREEWALDTLSLGRDLTLIELGQPIVNISLSLTYGLLTRTTFHSYFIRLRHEPPLVEGLRWVSEAEVRAGQMLDGQIISVEPLEKLLTQYSLQLDTLLSEDQRWIEERLAA